MPAGSASAPSEEHPRLPSDPRLRRWRTTARVSMPADREHRDRPRGAAGWGPPKTGVVGSLDLQRVMRDREHRDRPRGAAGWGPPKTGVVGSLDLQRVMRDAITRNNPECHLMVVLVDERPEAGHRYAALGQRRSPGTTRNATSWSCSSTSGLRQVTDMQRSVKGDGGIGGDGAPAETAARAARAARAACRRLR